MKCDIIIPAYNSPATLPEVLEAVRQQTIPAGWHINVITADRGGSKNAGPGTARNHGLEKSSGEVVFFLGADIFLRPGTLARHLEFHTHHPNQVDAALGLVVWDPCLPPSPFMEWMVHGGPQNNFDALLGEQQADPNRFFYGSHISLKRSLIGGLRFRDFGPYGWEDIDFGQQLARRSLKLHVLHSAVGLHHHFYSVSDIARRQRRVGQGAPQGEVPARSHLNHLRRRLFVLMGGQVLLHAILRYTAHKYSTPRLFLFFSANEFWKGVWKGQSTNKG